MLSRVVRIICGLGAFGVIATSTVSLVGWIGQTTETTSTTIEARGVVAIDVRTNAGAIVVNGGDKDTIEISRRASFAFAKPHFDESTEKGILTLHAYCSRTAFGPCDVTYEITVPRGVSVRARSGGGSITVRDVDGTVDVDSSAGGVRAERVSGPLTMSSSAGDIDAVDIRSADVGADTSAGSVRLSFVVAPNSVKARSEAGSVRVTVPDDAATYHVEAATSVGSTQVLVRTNPTSARSINVSTSAGSVYVEYPNN